MERKIVGKLEKWKNTAQGKSAVLLEGARRVGKSYAVEMFAKRCYKSYLILDFGKVADEIKRLFVENLEDLDTLFLYLQNYYHVELPERESLIVLDEVQLYPQARAAVKHLVADGRYDYVETGSLVSIKDNVKDILIPSEEQHMEMVPMDFEEFLWAMGEDKLYEMVRECYVARQPLGVLHRKLMEYLRLYEIVGGMPQAVEAYAAMRDFGRVDQIKRNILDLYRDDIKKHAGTQAQKVERVFDDVPAQLQHHDKKFRLAELEEGARMRSYVEAFVWLEDAKIVSPCYNTTAPTVGLNMNLERASMKLYMADTGLLISQAFSTKELVDEEVYKKILFDKLAFNGGMVVENLVAQMLKASGHRLYFYSNASREEKDDRMEVDFLVQTAGVTSRHNISPIEVKSGKNYTLSSLNKYCRKFHNEAGEAYVVHTGDMEEREGVRYVPLYMVGEV